uniref:Uncharacterized protein n=1 Tax=Arundo donax TaxID=35708 RepID=A0A0A9BJH9_ARUDO
MPADMHYPHALKLMSHFRARRYLNCYLNCRISL